MAWTCFRCSLLLVVGLVFISSCQLTAAQGNASYVVVAPKFVRPNSNYDVSATIFKSSGDVTIDVSLRDDGDKRIVENRTTIATGSSATITLKIPAVLLETTYNLHVEGSGGLSINNSKTVEVKTKTLSIFVQTDKAMYKPGQPVLFRVITVRSDLKPFTGDVNISISDDAGNKIAQWLRQHNDTGVFTNRLQLSDEPPIGTWSITAVAEDNTFTKTFDVAKYVLPTFEVKVELPSYYVIKLNKRNQQQDLLARVTAIYTYGQKVKGRASVSVSVSSYYSETKPRRLLNVELVDGAADIRLTMSDLLSLVPNSSYYNYNNYDPWQTLAYRQIIVVANVTETVSGKVLSGNNTVQCTAYKYALTFMDITASNFKPGLDFYAYMQLKQYDGSPPAPTEIQSSVVNVMVTFIYPYLERNYSYSAPQSVSKLQVPIPATGLMSFIIAIDPKCSSVNLQADFYDSATNSTSTAYKYLSKFSSRDNEGLQVSLNNSDGQIMAGQTAVFNLKSTANISLIFYQLLGKGVIYKSGTVTSSSLSTQHQLSVVIDTSLAQKLAPKGRIVAWYFTALGELIADSLDFSVNGAFANNVSVSFSASTVRPADNVTVSVSAYSQSVVGLLAVDQSVLLLKSGNDITQDQVLEDLTSYDSGSSYGGGYYPPRGPGIMDKRRRKRSIMCRGCWWPYFSGGSDTSEVLENAGLVIISDAYIHEITWDYLRNSYAERLDFAEAPLEDAGAPMVGAGMKNKAMADSVDKPTVAVRKNFPETWLWSDVEAGPDGRATVRATVPDTITSWVLSAFAVSSDVGLGVAPTPAKLTVFLPFFVSLNLPYSVKRGEEFAVQCILFNYQSTALQVTVTILRSTLFQIRDENGIVPANQDVSSSIQVPSNDAASVYFWMIPQSLGQIPVQVRATSPTASDAAKFTLLVEPEGVPQEYSTSVLVRLSAGQNFNATLNVSLPADGILVPGSQFIQVTAIGDLMGQSLSGLANLLQMPYGCGEQNMLNFAPDVYILKYLHISGQDTGPIGQSALKFLSEGYQRELTYKRDDGSYSAFGNSDKSGSIWLSSFVIKCFHEARPFIPVDEEKIADTLQWIVRNQSANGSFAEPPEGRVIHTDMQGGSSGGVALTAYILIALLENADNTHVDARALQSARTKATGYIESQLSAVRTDPYALSIITYALTLANSSSASTSLQYLNALATNKDGMKYWHRASDSDVPAPGSMPEWRPPYEQARSVDIEMTGYALLTYAKLKNINDGIAIAKWIVSQRNSLGGFSSTQDTVVALQALAEFAAITSGGAAGTENLLIALTAGSLSHQFQIIESNALVLQSVQIPSDVTQINLQATGTGFGLVQLNVKYHVVGIDNKTRRRKRDTSTVGGSTDVELDVEQTQTDDKHLTVNVSARYTGSRVSGMSIISVGILTGYVVENVDQIKSQSPDIKRVDSDTSSVTIYLDQLTSSWTRVSVQLYRNLMIDNVQPATVTAYLYYDPGQRDTVVYQPATVNTTFCDQCPQCCSCPAEGCGSSTRKPTSLGLQLTSQIPLTLFVVILCGLLLHF